MLSHPPRVGNDLKKLHAIVPPEQLPVEFGGTLVDTEGSPGHRMAYLNALQRKEVASLTSVGAHAAACGDVPTFGWQKFLTKEGLPIAAGCA